MRHCRYGFNGKENDNEVKGIEGSQQDYGMRIYDPRVGRFLSVDPLAAEYPELTPYQFAGNGPITFIDRDGAEQTYKMPDGSLYIHPHSDHLRLPIPQYVQQNGTFISAGKGDLSGVSATLDFIPAVGSLKGAIEGVAGKDLEGNELSTRERLMGVVPYLGKVKKITKVVKAADKIDEANDAAKAASKIDDSKKALDKVGDSKVGQVQIPKDPTHQLRRRLAEHEKKLEEYIADPYKFDNKGFLKNAPNDEVRKKIIQTRVDHLKKEIKAFQENIEKAAKSSNNEN